MLFLHCKWSQLDSCRSVHDSLREEAEANPNRGLRSLTCQDSGTRTGSSPVGETRAPEDNHIQESTSHFRNESNMCGSVTMLHTWGFRRVLNSPGRAIQPSVGTTVWIHKDIWALEDWQVSATEIQLYYYPFWSLGDQESPEALYWLIFRICCTVFQIKSWCITDPSHYNSKVILTQLSRRLTKEPVLGRGTKLLRFAPELPNVGMQPMLRVPVHPAREEDLHTFPLCSNNCQYGTVTGYHWHRLQAFLCKCTYLAATDSLSPSLGYRKHASPLLVRE